MTPKTPTFLRADIPTEIYLSIVDYLPECSLAALILTNKHVLQIYGSKHWKSLEHDSAQRALFLLLLERDLEDYYYSKPLLRKWISESTPSNCADTDVRYTKYSVLARRFHYTITWPHLILALKQDLYGAHHGLPLEAFTHAATSTIPSPSDPSDIYTIQLSISAQVITRRLLLRCTYRISCDSHAIIPSQLAHLDLFLCRHVGTAARSSPWYDNTLAQKLSRPCYTSHDDDEDDDVDYNALLNNSVPQSFRHHCCFCITDYQATPNADGSYTIMTWQSFGDGNYDPGDGQPVSPRDPASELWAALADSDRGALHVCRVLAYPDSSVRQAYEDGESKN
ncbi:hypothetical protein CC86DRAFT_411410 [Ophiobolus disseminans]|uniref:F-box domain-containing protein n=1 Tax=Ophiobolus disseminans TaxID=1469910 RepID=A0A6A6ZLI9_9PLEO|nr:hypothetical protein CC86DRAFT_411410 [Ophiobolus disseminans]